MTKVQSKFINENDNEVQFSVEEGGELIVLRASSPASETSWEITPKEAICLQMLLTEINKARYERETGKPYFIQKSNND
jgi:predicted secreted protein